MDPLEESVVAARMVKDDWTSLAELLGPSATIEIEEAAKGFLKEWGFGMGRVAEHADEVLARLQKSMAAYLLAELLGVKNFTPTDDNIAKLPAGAAGKWSWEHVGKPSFDPPRGFLQEEWPDNGEVSA